MLPEISQAQQGLIDTYWKYMDTVTLNHELQSYVRRRQFHHVFYNSCPNNTPMARNVCCWLFTLSENTLSLLAGVRINLLHTSGWLGWVLVNVWVYYLSLQFAVLSTSVGLHTPIQAKEAPHSHIYNESYQDP